MTTLAQSLRLTGFDQWYWFSRRVITFPTAVSIIRPYNRSLDAAELAENRKRGAAWRAANVAKGLTSSGKPRIGRRGRQKGWKKAA